MLLYLKIIIQILYILMLFSCQDEKPSQGKTNKLPIEKKSKKEKDELSYLKDENIQLYRDFDIFNMRPFDKLDKNNILYPHLEYRTNQDSVILTIHHHPDNRIKSGKDIFIKKDNFYFKESLIKDNPELYFKTYDYITKDYVLKYFYEILKRDTINLRITKIYKDRSISLECQPNKISRLPCIDIKQSWDFDLESYIDNNDRESLALTYQYYKLEGDRLIINIEEDYYSNSEGKYTETSTKTELISESYFARQDKFSFFWHIFLNI